MSKKDEVPEKCLSKALLTRLAESTVAPFVGAWIETGVYAIWFALTNCRTLRGCVD